jgi:hypothetical protein
MYNGLLFTYLLYLFIHRIRNLWIKDALNGDMHVYIIASLCLIRYGYVHNCTNICICIGAIRELEEESSLIVSGENMLRRGYIVFNMKESKKIMKVHVYESWYAYMHIYIYTHT